MKRNSKKLPRRPLRIWTFEQVLRAVPYLSSVLRSLREHRLDMVTHHLKVQRLEEKPGRPDRAALLAVGEAQRAADQARDRFEDARRELRALDIRCLDPLTGQALIPFLHEGELAWYIFDLFDSDPLLFWRYHTDPLDMRRPLAEAISDPTEPTWLA